MSSLNNAVQGALTEPNVANKSVVVGAELKGKTTIGTSGAPPTEIAPQLEGVVSEMGGIGTKNSFWEYSWLLRRVPCRKSIVIRKPSCFT
jgi:hypothetical protein